MHLCVRERRGLARDTGLRIHGHEAVQSGERAHATARPRDASVPPAAGAETHREWRIPSEPDAGDAGGTQLPAIPSGTVYRGHGPRRDGGTVGSPTADRGTVRERPWGVPRGELSLKDGAMNVHPSPERQGQVTRVPVRSHFPLFPATPPPP